MSDDNRYVWLVVNWERRAICGVFEFKSEAEAMIRSHKDRWDLSVSECKPQRWMVGEYE